VRPYRIEAVVFAFSLLPLIIRRRPNVVYLSEWDTARALAALRPLTRQRFMLLLSNGTLAYEGFDHLDRVQDLTPLARQFVLDRGADPGRHVVLPLGFQIPPQRRPISSDEKRTLRSRLGLPTDRMIVLSASALNRYHKRLDYVIEEVASIPEQRPFLVLAGQPEEETPGLRSLARDRLGAGHSIRTVAASEMPDLYRASDVFVLASLWEGLPRALIEASAYGLPCLTHDYAIASFALGPHGLAADLRERGALARLVTTLGEADFSAQRQAERHRYAYEHFSWDRLAGRYVELMREVAGCDAPAGKLASE
jgi:glycosyltransferase involved in cell wall biosynthesis